MRKSILLVLVLFSYTAIAQEISVMRFREIEGGAQHLYKVTCISGAGSKCSVQTISLRGPKRGCTIEYSQLANGVTAINPAPGTYTLSVTGGACNYTNTYTFSPKGMVQVKTGPRKKAMTLCEVFSPKTYNIPVSAETEFAAVPVEGCSAMSVSF